MDRAQLLPVILDRRAESDPDRIWAKFPVSATCYDQGFRAATHGQIRNAVNRVAWMLAETIGTSSHFDTLAYLGPGDLRYHVVILAAIKTGYKAFLPSPRNSTAAQRDLLARLDCVVLATTDPAPPFVSSILDMGDCPFRTVVRIPPLDVLLHESDHVPPYPYDKSFEAARHDPVLVLHTSGSTGTPKPLTYTNEFIWRIYQANTLPAPPGTTRVDDYFLRGEFFSFLPAFHIAGIGWGLVLPMFADSIPVLPLPGRPPSTDSFLQALKHGRFDWAFLLPVIIDEVSRDAEALALVAERLQYLFYTGGALPPAAGETVSARIPVFSGLGSSECSALPQLLQVHSNTDNDKNSSEAFADTNTWQFVRIHPAAGAEFRHCMDDLHELVIVRSAEHPEAQPVFAMFPHLGEYATRDLFSPHPRMPGLWRHRGRRDDIVVFLNGEKTNPISFEQEVARHPAVQAALVAGSQRLEACLLVEPAEGQQAGPLSDSSAKAALIQDIWPAVEEANRHCPAHARIAKSKILVLDPDRPMLRAAKGTVQREGTLRLFAAEIDALYAEAKQPTPGNIISISSLKDAVNALRGMVAAHVPSWSQSHFDMHTDFFSAAGMDSLQVLRLSAAIRSSMGIPSVTPAVIYRNPSIHLLAQHIYQAAIGNTSSDAEEMENHMATMASLLRRYEQKVDQIHIAAAAGETRPPPGENMPTAENQEVVLLTGSTGTVGSFLLNQLLENPGVAHIYCLNRAPDSGVLQRARNRQRGLPCYFHEDRVTFLTTGGLARDQFGLTSTEYTTLLDRTTQIIHAAWPVDFNQPLCFFEPSLDGLIGLLAFAHRARQRPSLLFLSSISAVSSYCGHLSHLIPEEPILDDMSSSCPAAPFGYGESKYLAERVMAYYAATTTTTTGPCGVVRIAQVAGPTTASTQRPCCWNGTEWLPSLVRSSRHLRALPASLGVDDNDDNDIGERQGRGGAMGFVDYWVPVNVLASVLVELSFSLRVTESGKKSSSSTGDGSSRNTSSSGGGLEVFHCANAHPVPWNTDDGGLVPILVGALSKKAGEDISLVGFREWLERLEKSAAACDTPADLERNPAVKLLDFYRRLIVDTPPGGPPSSTRLCLQKTMRVSKSLATLGQIQPEWMAAWVQDWLEH